MGSFISYKKFKNMRIISIAAALGFVASVAYAQQDLDLDEDDYDLELDDDLEFDDDYDAEYDEMLDRRLEGEDDKPKKVPCKERPPGPNSSAGSSPMRTMPRRGTQR